MKRALVVLVLALVNMFALYGETKEFTIEDAMLARRKGLTPSRVSYSWIPGTSSYTWVKGKTMYMGKTGGKKKSELITVKILAEKLKGVEAFSELKRFPRYKWISRNSIRIKGKNSYVVLKYPDFTPVRTLKVDKKAANLTPDSSSVRVAATVENNIFIFSEGKKIQVTNEKDKGVVCGQTVSRNEFGVSGGLFWSPSGNLLAFYRKDEREVKSYPIVSIEKRPAEVRMVKYPMAGQRSEDLTIGIYNLKTRKTVWLKTDGEAGLGKEQYLPSITWGPGEKEVLVAHLNRGQNHLRINRYSAAEGNFNKTVYEEKHSKFVEPKRGFIHIGTKKNRMIWMSRASGFNHIKLFDNRGNFLKDLTRGNWDITRFLGSDRKGANLYYESAEVSPVERHIYRVNVKSGKRVKLTKGEGMHYGRLSGDGRYVMESFSSPSVPGIQQILNRNGRVVRVLHKSVNPLKDFNLGSMEIVKLKAEDGKTDLYARIIKPADFDPSKKYPVIIYVYGGPHSQLVKKSWLGGGRLWQYYMSQKGYIAFTLDNRGTDARGRDFENAIHRQIGIPETSDQMMGVKYLKSLPFVDSERIGVHGWSYGGFMTLNMMLRHPEAFKTGVAGGPVTDYRYYEVMYGERYMDTPEDNAEGYKNSDLNSMAANLKGRLMLIHGAQDDVVVWQHSQKFLRECVKSGKLVDYLIYPTHPHNVRGKDRIHLMRHVTRYFEEHL